MNLAEGLEQRIIRLEESSYFQEEKIKALDGQILSLQAQVDNLENSLAAMRNELIRFRDVLTSQPGELKQEFPPHYQTLDWHKN